VRITSATSHILTRWIVRTGEIYSEESSSKPCPCPYWLGIDLETTDPEIRTARLQNMHLPWITMDKERRDELKVKPWQTVLITRSSYDTLASGFGELAIAIAVSSIGGAVVTNASPVRSTICILAGLLIASVLILAKIRSRA
jgi:hypothetical protein